MEIPSRSLYYRVIPCGNLTQSKASYRTNCLEVSFDDNFTSNCHVRHPGANTNHIIDETKKYLEYRQVTCC